MVTIRALLAASRRFLGAVLADWTAREVAQHFGARYLASLAARTDRARRHRVIVPGCCCVGECRGAGSLGCAMDLAIERAEAAERPRTFRGLSAEFPRNVRRTSAVEC
jgi:hypothetical protein